MSIFILLSGFISFIGFVLIAKVYNVLDLSVAYPISRSQALFVPFFSIFFFDKFVSFIGGLGIFISVLGVFTLCDLKTLKKTSFLAILFSLIIPIIFALQACIDKLALKHIDPSSYFYAYSFVASICFLILAIIRYEKTELKAVIKYDYLKVIKVAIFNYFSFVFFLKAINIGDVSYLTAFRQLSFVFATILAYYLLKEDVGKRRVIATALILIGSLILTQT